VTANHLAALEAVVALAEVTVAGTPLKKTELPEGSLARALGTVPVGFVVKHSADAVIR
jgi:hypothetical protein